MVKKSKNTSGKNTITKVMVLSAFSLAISALAQTKLESWITKGDQSVLLSKQKPLKFTSNKGNSTNQIIVDASKKFQTIDGFGYTLTYGSVQVINTLNKEERTKLLRELFGKDANGISVSYIRLSVAASDLNPTVFSYDDVEGDVELKHFSLEKDRIVIEMLKEILKLNPDIKLMSAPWSAPAWMKDNNSSKGGSLKPEHFDTYARYFVKYIQEMQKQGITIDAITPQNEPLHPGNVPSMYMSAESQRDFIKYNLGPAFEKAGIKTKIVVYDHNCNKPEYPIAILNDLEAKKYIDGSAFHLYEGEISALSTVHNAHPDKSLYFTEQWTGSRSDFKGDLNWHLRNVVIGSMRNWSKNALEWNLANDADFNPHTDGGCTECKGAITVHSSNKLERNVAYYIIAHASKFVPQNSVRIASTQTEKLATAAFKTPQGKYVLLVQNDAEDEQNFEIKMNNKVVKTSLSGKSVASYVF